MKTSYDHSAIPQIPNARIAILQSKWYREYTDKLVEKCKFVLSHSCCLDPVVHVLPGALELPLAAKHLCLYDKHKYDAIICIGAIMKGETYHFEMILNECIRSLGQVMLEQNIPILVEILPVTSTAHLSERCGDNEYNKGIEAALAAAEIIHWRRSIYANSSST
jgi:6,7-dimethyl-8-ribityllumazine synthase